MSERTIGDALAIGLSLGSFAGLGLITAVKAMTTGDWLGWVWATAGTGFVALAIMAVTL